MANPVVADTLDTVSRATTVVKSATALINGFSARVQAGIDQALANGASEAELAPVQAVVDAFDADVAELSAAVVANTPAA